MYYNLSEFGFKIRQLRESMSLTQKDLYKSSGISIATLTRIELGQVLPKEAIYYELLIPKMNRILIDCFYENDIIKRNMLFDKAMKNITKNLVPIRPDRSLLRNWFLSLIMRLKFSTFKL
ncbi:MAG: hypothetical protein COA82_11235 [Alkaliphilus sp.]|nr:helix-turn-helix domain-containing protein [bacterium AH-315-L21]MBN4069434.1 helix-turn-helix domain-containing protein [bacterium AH-315-G05]MBN4074493.1 helix-turn-helix domain-containing protein [bacterium AH-315-E09]PHS30628.1 MAG: hypothetical protein COA82_11235 [Alkaliphilus sp.]